jgi:AcrR family transcriptional regulator
MDQPTTLETPPKPSGVRAGRPTAAQAQARHEALLDAALDHFLDLGFESATVEAIAGAVNMTKRTIYARYPDKVSLFRAAVRRAIDRLAVPPETIAAIHEGSIETILTRYAYLRIDLVTGPAGLKLQRIINTESYRFPDIFQSYYRIAALPVIRSLADLLAAETAAGRLSVEDPLLAANIFISMVSSGPVRIIVSGNHMSREEIERRVAFAVRLFLDGTLPR